MKKVIIYIRSLNASGGIERVVVNLIEKWKNEYDICVITKDDGKSFYYVDNRIRIIPLNKMMKMNMKNRIQRIFESFISIFRYSKIIRKVLKEENPDYIYITSPNELLEICLFSKKYRNKVVSSEHGSFFGYNKIYRLIKKIYYPKIYCVPVLNKMDTEIYKGWGTNAVYIPHLLTFTPTSKNELNTKILLNVGRLTADKQQSLLIDAWSKIEEKNGWKLYIVGDGEEKENLERRILNLNLSDSVYLFPSTKNIKKFYNMASFFVLSSRFEGFGMVLLEAMSFGIPCISFDCPSGPRDIIVDGFNGYLVENNNIELLCKCLNNVITMENEDLSILGDGAFETVLNWNNDLILKRWNEIFK